MFLLEPPLPFDVDRNFPDSLFVDFQQFSSQFSTTHFSTPRYEPMDHFVELKWLVKALINYSGGWETPYIIQNS
jgi:hypothetical protein